MDTHDPQRQPLLIHADHPALPGHFPGEPVVPGVVLLDRVLAQVERLGGRGLARIHTVKFLAPLLPGQAAWLEVAIRDGRVRFTVADPTRMIMRGEGELE